VDFWERLEETVNSKSNRKTVAIQAGIPTNSFSNWKKRRTYPAADVIVRVAHELKVSVDYLVDGVETPLSLASSISARPALRVLVERLASRSDEDIIRATALIDVGIFGMSSGSLAPPRSEATG